jgi:hypothetical protein
MLAAIALHVLHLLIDQRPHLPSPLNQLMRLASSRVCFASACTITLFVSCVHSFGVLFLVLPGALSTGRCLAAWHCTKWFQHGISGLSAFQRLRFWGSCSCLLVCHLLYPSPAQRPASPTPSGAAKAWKSACFQGQFKCIDVKVRNSG